MKRFLQRLSLLLAVLLLLTTAVFADFGPKPQLVVRVEQPPQEEYYLDLLDTGDWAKNLYDLDERELDPALLAALRAAGATFEGEGTPVKENPVTHADLLDLGLIGAGSKAKRVALLRALALPEHLSTAALLDVLGTLTTREELVEECNKIVANRE